MRIILGGLAAISLAAGVCCALSAPRAPQVRQSTPRLRHPIAAAFVDEGRTLCVANQRSGSVALVDVEAGRVLDEKTIGKRLNDLAILPDRKRFLTVDDERHELISLSVDANRLRVRTRLTTARFPVSVAVLKDGKRATIACLWSRCVQIVEPNSLRILHTLRLPFAPRCQCVLPGGSQVAVADAFGGHLALVDADAGRVLLIHQTRWHNLHGLAVSADGQDLLLAHQVLNQETPTLEEKIWNGTLMANVVNRVPLVELRKPKADLDEVGESISLKGNGKGAGDPAGVAVLNRDRFVVALSGVNDLAVVDGDLVRRILVGRRPTAIVPVKRGAAVVALNTFDDSLSVVDTEGRTVVRTISLGRMPLLSSAERGELSFYDAHLSRDGWFSCHSCHADGHTNGLLADTLGDGTHGTPKRTLTLRGTALTDPWAWNGSMKYLQDQIEQSLTSTMHAPTLSGEQTNDLLSFLHTLPPPPPLEPAREDRKDREQIERGRELFRARGCVRCHIAPLTYSSHDVHDVGFADECGLRKYNPPSLRGVSQGYRFLHDNRAESLEEVFTKYRHKVGPGLTPAELDDLLRFLRSL